jgi:hypothetical protein
MSNPPGLEIHERWICHQIFRTDVGGVSTQRHAIMNHAVETPSEMNTAVVSEAKLHTNILV